MSLNCFQKKMKIFIYIPRLTVITEIDRIMYWGLIIRKLSKRTKTTKVSLTQIQSLFLNVNYRVKNDFKRNVSTMVV